MQQKSRVYSVYNKSGDLYATFYGIKQVANHFSVANSTVSYWVSKGKTKHGFKIIKRYYSGQKFLNNVGKCDMVVTSKACSKCGLEKKLEMYKKQETGKYGRRANCRECDKEIR